MTYEFIFYLSKRFQLKNIRRFLIKISKKELNSVPSEKEMHNINYLIN